MIDYEDLGKSNAAFTEEYVTTFRNFLDGGWYILGRAVESFEAEFAKYCGSDYCVGVANGLEAITLSIMSLGLPQGSEVIIPSNTFVATIIAVLNANCVPVLVEPEIDTYNINPSLIENSISNKTKCIVVVHLYGKPCNMDSIMKVAEKYNLKIIEDAAQAHGAMYKGKKVGSFGDFGAFSFYPTKNLGALGDAGAITVKAETQNEKLRALRNYGSNRKYYNDYVGYNSRLDECQAMFLSIKLKYLEDINRHKRRLAKLYNEGISEDFIKPVIDPEYHDVYHIYSVRHPKRDQLRRYLLDNDVKTEIHYPLPPNKQKAMKGILDRFDTPIAEEIHNTTLSLPISYSHTEDQIEKVIDLLNSF